MLVIGGRTNNVGESVPLEVYDTESSEWTKFPSVQRFRHACWVLDNNLYVHGGFEQESPNVPTDSIAKIDITSYFQSHPILMKYITANQNNSNTMSTSKQNENIPPNQNQITSQLGQGKTNPGVRSDQMVYHINA